MPGLRIPDITNAPSKVQLLRLSYVSYAHPDLESFCKFANDFGFIEEARVNGAIYFRGYGKDPFVYQAIQSDDNAFHFLGPAFVAASREEFDKAAKIPGAGPVKPLDAPGSGHIISIARPNGTFMHVVFGQTERQTDEKPPTSTHITHGPANEPFSKPRAVGKFQRYKTGPALVHKLGHCGYVCAEFDEEVEWYTSYFNFVPSDILYDKADPEVDVMTFMHLDLGQDWSDHHILFIARAKPDQSTEVHHTSYEVHDFDTQLLGHQHLANQGWKSVWGVGRHVLGSQIFDYWRDSSGGIIEHYADGDVVNTTIPTRRDAAGPLSVWGPELPADFGVDGA